MNLNFKTFGSGEPLLILHGLFGLLDNWQTMAKRLAEKHTVFIVDQRNHGRSPHHPDMDYPTMANDIVEFMDQNWVYNAHVLGHSMGGKVAMQIAFDYPDRINKLIVADIAPKAYPGRHFQMFDALLTLQFKGIKERDDIEIQLEKTITDYAIRQFLMKNLGRNKDGGFKWKMNLEALKKNYENILAEVSGEDGFDGETLFIIGGRSKHVLGEDVPRIRTIFPNVKIQTIPTAGHWLHSDAPDAFFHNCIDFLD